MDSACGLRSLLRALIAISRNVASLPQTRAYPGRGYTVGGPLVDTHPIEKFFSKPNVGGPNGLSLSGRPSIEVGGEAPHLN